LVHKDVVSQRLVEHGFAVLWEEPSDPDATDILLTVDHVVQNVPWSKHGTGGTLEVKPGGFLQLVCRVFGFEDKANVGPCERVRDKKLFDSRDMGLDFFLENFPPNGCLVEDLCDNDIRPRRSRDDPFRLGHPCPSDTIPTVPVQCG
jgi:hypothetical protein